MAALGARPGWVGMAVGQSTVAGGRYQAEDRTVDPALEYGGRDRRQAWPRVTLRLVIAGWSEYAAVGPPTPPTLRPSQSMGYVKCRCRIRRQGVFVLDADVLRPEQMCILLKPEIYFS